MRFFLPSDPKAQIAGKPQVRHSEHSDAREACDDPGLPVLQHRRGNPHSPAITPEKRMVQDLRGQGEKRIKMNGRSHGSYIPHRPFIMS